MPRTLDQMFNLQDLRACPVITLQLVLATRLTIVHARVGRESLPDLAVRLRSLRAAQGVETLVATIDRIWPEPFTIHRPCCTTMSPDETLLAQVVTAAARGNRQSAMDAMRDLLPCLSRDRLFRDAIEVVDAIRAAQDQSASDRR